MINKMLNKYKFFIKKLVFEIIFKVVEIYKIIEILE